MDPLKVAICKGIIRLLETDWKDDPRAASAVVEYRRQLTELENQVGPVAPAPGPFDQVVGMKTLHISGQIGGNHGRG
jgi:hypothetical protein